MLNVDPRKSCVAKRRAGCVFRLRMMREERKSAGKVREMVRKAAVTATYVVTFERAGRRLFGFKRTAGAEARCRGAGIFETRPTWKLSSSSPGLRGGIAIRARWKPFAANPETGSISAVWVRGSTAWVRLGVRGRDGWKCSHSGSNANRRRSRRCTGWQLKPDRADLADRKHGCDQTERHWEGKH